MSTLYRKERLFLLAVDPVHVGAGGHHLGRVDMPIVREPGTRLPKVPGTSLSGAARQYAALVAGRREAAGQHRNLKGKDRDASKCPILATFGTAADADSAGSKAGAVRIGDARLLCYPVWSKRGPVWVATREALLDAGLEVSLDPVLGAEEAACAGEVAPGTSLNFGWLQMALRGGLAVAVPAGHPLAGNAAFAEVLGRLYVLSEKMLSVVVNSNLEVRTSVSIDPTTGAAAKGALFSYEAIARGAWLHLEAVEEPYLCTADLFQDGLTPEQGDAGETWRSPMDVFRAGVRRMEMLGVGGMGTRGFGRMKLMEAAQAGAEVQK